MKQSLVHIVQHGLPNLVGYLSHCEFYLYIKVNYVASQRVFLRLPNSFRRPLSSYDSIIVSKDTLYKSGQLCMTLQKVCLSSTPLS